MSLRPVDWHPLADADPVPGDPDAVQRCAARLRRTAAMIRDTAAGLRRVAGAGGWESDAGRSFRVRARRVAASMEGALDRYDVAAAALEAFHPALGRAQARAGRALASARAADAAARRADAAPAGTPGAVAASADAAAAMAAARRGLAEAVADRDDAVRRAVGAIWHVSSRDAVHDRFRDHLVAAVRKTAGIAGTIASVCGIASILVAWIPVVGPALSGILGTVAIAATVLSLACDVFLFATAGGPWTAIAWDVVNLVTAGIGRGFSRTAQETMNTGRSAARLTALGDVRRANPALSRGEVVAEVDRLTGGPAGDAAASGARVRGAATATVPVRRILTGAVTGYGRDLRDGGAALRSASRPAAARATGDQALHPVRTVRSVADGGGGLATAHALAGQHALAAQFARAVRIDPALRADPQVAGFLDRASVQAWAGFVGCAGSGLIDPARLAVHALDLGGNRHGSKDGSGDRRVGSP